MIGNSFARDVCDFSRRKCNLSLITLPNTATMLLPPSPSKAEKENAKLPDPSLAPAPSSDDQFTAQDLINKQAQLEREAREAIPFQVSQCTYAMGSIRQPVFSCIDCGGGGVCGGCSVQCHGGEYK